MRAQLYTPPDWLTTVNASLFVVMSSVSILQNTIFLRNFTLIAGALIGAYLIYKNSHFFNIKNSIPLITLSLLFIWVLVHYFLFSGDQQSQLQELSSVWKRVFLSFIFAVGLGLSIQGANRLNTALVIWGFAASLIVFYLRWVINILGFGASSPFFILNYFSPDALGYVPKYYFSTFIVPLITIAYCFLAKILILPGRYHFFSIMLTCIALLAALYIFYAVGNKNGILYFLCISLGFFSYLFTKHHNKISFRAYLFLGFFLASLSSLIYMHIKAQPTWTTFVVDAKAALDFEHNEQWKYSGAKGYPLNELGNAVSITAYERVAWAVKGSELLLTYPMGYGLVINSFGPLAKKRWPDSSLTHSHSGWLDIGLAFGIPGLSLILIALFSTVLQCSRTSTFISKSGAWVLLSMVLVFISSEVSERILFDYLIFLIAFFAASSINAD